MPIAIVLVCELHMRLNIETQVGANTFTMIIAAANQNGCGYFLRCRKICPQTEKRCSIGTHFLGHSVPPGKYS